MKFPHAAKGVKKIFLSEIIELIGSILMFAAGGFAYWLKFTDTTAAADLSAAFATQSVPIIIMFCLIITGVVITVIAAIIGLIGIINASRDSMFFKIALFSVIIGVAANISGLFFPAGSFMSNLMNILYYVFNFSVTLEIIQGIIILAEKLGNQAVAAKGKTTLKVIFAIIILSLLSSVAYSFFPFANANLFIGLGLIGLTLVLSVIQYFLYLSLLAKAKKMLARSK